MAPRPTPPPPEALHEAARSSVGAVPGGLDVAEDLGEVFDGLADRMDYTDPTPNAFTSWASAWNGLCRPTPPGEPCGTNAFSCR